MRRALVALPTIILALGLTAGPVLAITPGSVVDQAQLTVAVSVNDSRSVAQTFTAGLTGSLTDVRLYIDSPNGNSLTVTLNSTSGGSPTSTVLATSGASAVAVAADWVTFTFASPATVTSGTMYAIVFNMSDLTGEPTTYGSATDVYAGGAALVFLDPGWVGINQVFLDFAFDTYVAAAGPSATPVIDPTAPPTDALAPTASATPGPDIWMPIAFMSILCLALLLVGRQRQSAK